MWFGPQSNTLNIEFLGLVYFLSGGPSSNAAFYQQESQEKRALNPHMSLSFCLVSQFSISNFWDLYIFSQEGRPATLHSISRNLKKKDPHRKVDKARSHGLQKPEPSTIG